ncbi:MAG: S9 family peptidase, partial [Thermomicrobiales bacterium]
MGADQGNSSKRSLTSDDLYRLTFVSDPQLSPDGAAVAFVRTTIDRDADAYRSRIWLAPADGATPPRAFTAGPNDTAPRWSPDGQTLAFLAKRNGAAKAQVWLIGARGGEAWPLTALDEGVADPQWSPDGTRIACASQVGTASADKHDSERKSDVRVIDRLKHKQDGEGVFDDRRRHLFVVPVRDQERGEARQLTFGD